MQLVRARGFISVSSLFVLCSVKLQKRKERKKDKIDTITNRREKKQKIVKLNRFK